MTDVKNLKLSEVLDELYSLREQNQELKLDNDFLEKQNNSLKIRCGKYCLENKKLSEEIADMKFTRKYLTSEEAGKMFVSDFGGA